MDVVPTATMRRPSRRASWRRAHTAASTLKLSLCSVVASRLSCLQRLEGAEPHVQRHVLDVHARGGERRVDAPR